MSLSEDQETEREQRRQAWLAAPLVPYDGLAQCACCLRKLNLRHVPATGDICERCYIKAPICSVDGCDDVAVDVGKCRHHFMGDCADAPGDLDIRRFAGFRASSVGQFQGKWGGLACD